MKTLKKNSLVSGAGIYLIANILNGIIPFILLPILTRYLTPTEYGEVAMFQTLLGALAAFTGSVFIGAAGRKNYDSNIKKEDIAQFVGSVIQLITLSTIFVLIIIWIIQDYLSEILSLPPNFIILATITTSFIAITRIRLSQWQVTKQAFKYGVLQLSQSICNMFISLLFVVVMLKGSDGRINAQVITAFIFLFISLHLLKKDNLLNIFIWRKDYISEALKFGIPLIPHLVGGFLLGTADRFVINKDIGITEAGVYMVAVQLTAAIAIVFDALNKAYVPWLYEKLKENNPLQKARIVKYTYIWFAVIILGACTSFYIGPPIVLFIAGKEYEAAGEIIGWLALGQGFQGMYLMVTNYIFFSKRTGLLSLSTFSSGAINLVLLLTLVQILGLKGAAISFAISMFIKFLLTWWIAYKRHSMPWFTFANY